jgi:hypothetical protein
MSVLDETLKDETSTTVDANVQLPHQGREGHGWLTLQGCDFHKYIQTVNPEALM